MAKRTTRKRARKIKEAPEYEVTVHDDTPGAVKTKTTTVVQAGNPEQAVDAAIDPADSIGGGTDDISIKKKVPGDEVDGETTQPGGVHMEKAKTKKIRFNAKKLAEAVEYPYTVFLPRPFKSFLERTNIATSEVGHGMMIRFTTKSQLTSALRELNKMGGDKASIILNGIRESIQCQR